MRRWTGGGIVEHGADFTFTLLVPRSLPLAMLAARESYRLIHAAVAIALARVGCAGACLQTDTARKAITVSGECFENAVQHDLLVGHRKVAGGAQRRTRDGLLHQGSIQNAATTAAAAAAQAWGAGLAAALPGVFGKQIETCSLNKADLTSARTTVSAKYGATAWLHRF